MGKINLSNIQASLNRAKETAAPLQNKGHTENVPVDFIHLAESNVYNENDTDESIKELADNIEACGLLHPIAVHKISSYNYQIISGERRYRAITEYLHWKSIPCMVFEGLSKDSAQLKLYMANLAVREYTSGQRFKYYIEVKELLGRMAKSGEYTGGLQKGIAEILNVMERQVKRYAQVAKLPEEIQQAVIDGKISINKALEMSVQKEFETKNLDAENERINDLLSALTDEQRNLLLSGRINLSELISVQQQKGDICPLDDSKKTILTAEVANSQGDICPFDDGEKTVLTAEVANFQGDICPFDDGEKTISITEVANSQGDICPFDDGEKTILTTEVANSQGDICPFDDSKKTVSAAEVANSQGDICPFDDGEKTISITEIANSQGDICPLDDSKKTVSTTEVANFQGDICPLDDEKTVRQSKSLQNDSMIFYKNGHYVPNKIQVMEEHEQYTVFKVFAVKQ